MDQCNNCNAALEGHYCAHCGQRNSIGRITFKETAAELFDTFFAPQGPFLRTLRMLLLHPGQMMREYLAGKRKKYYKPVAFFLLATVLFLLIRWLLDFNPLKQPDGEGGLDEATMEDIVQASRYMFAHINQLLFILVFTLAIFMKLFHFRVHSLAEYLAISFYLVGVYSLITTINIFFTTYIMPGLQFLAMVIMLVYFIYAMCTWHTGKAFWTGLKAFFTWVLAIVTFMILAFGFSYMVILIQNR